MNFTSFNLSIVSIFVLAFAFIPKAHANSVVPCDGCDATQRQNAAGGGAPAGSGTHPVYVTDDGNKRVEKYEVTVESEPGFSFIQVALVPLEPAISAFITKYWQEVEQGQTADWIVDEAFSNGTPDFMANYAARARTLNNWATYGLPSQLNGSTVIGLGLLAQLTQHLQGFANNGFITVRLRFSDGGSVVVSIKLVIVSSPNAAAVSMERYEVVPGSAQVHGIPLPENVGDFNNFSVMGNSFNGDGLEAIYRYADLIGVQTSCVPNGQDRFTCDAHGKCTLEWSGSSCP